MLKEYFELWIVGQEEDTLLAVFDTYGEAVEYLNEDGVVGEQYSINKIYEVVGAH